MLKLGFTLYFVRMVLKCVTSVRFIVWMSGELLPFFAPTRGLRQRNQMSPYLFLLCGEGFTSLLNFYGGVNVDRGIRVSTRLPWVNHLFFADDSLIFMKAKKESALRPTIFWESMKTAQDSVLIEIRAPSISAPTRHNLSVSRWSIWWALSRKPSLRDIWIFLRQ
jgi:hypothetical protein